MVVVAVCMVLDVGFYIIVLIHAKMLSFTFLIIVLILEHKKVLTLLKN
jgi:hypothetical protein